MTNLQLELSLTAGRQTQYPPRRQNRQSRAAWWFGQMRRVVNNAMDWDAAPEPRPEQSWLEISHPRRSA